MARPLEKVIFKGFYLFFVFILIVILLKRDIMDNSLRENINKIIGNNVRFIRKTHKLSQEKFAEQVELSPQFISDVERGIEGISLTTAIKICNIMNCSSLVLFANLIEFKNYTNEMDKFTKLSDKNKDIVLNIIEALLKNQ